jgi:hypothetical protein
VGLFDVRFISGQYIQVLVGTRVNSFPIVLECLHPQLPKTHKLSRELDLPINTEIRWRINTYNNDTELEGLGPICVCHSVPINIGSV